MAEIAIIGGGIGGLSAALALREFGFEPEVFEQAPALLDVGAAIAIWPNAMRILERLGVAEKIVERAGVIKQVRWLNQDGKQIHAFFANRKPIACELLIGADGLHSDMRSQVVDDGPPIYRGY